MVLLNILDNQVLQMVAEISAIVIGSVLMGILLGYLYWGNYKKRVAYLDNKLDFERNLVADLNLRLTELSSIRDHLANELNEEKIRYNTQSKALYDQNLRLYSFEAKQREDKALIERLNEQIAQYEARLKVIESELIPNGKPVAARKPRSSSAVRANYEHVSQLLGRQVTEDDLTLVAGIGPRTEELLHKAGIKGWKALSEMNAGQLRELLAASGGTYKALDPTHWPLQAQMAANSEWRKLRLFQETLKSPGVKPDEDLPAG